MKFIGKDLSFKKFSKSDSSRKLEEIWNLDQSHFPYPWKVHDWQNLGPDFDLFYIEDISSKLVGFALFQVFPLDKRVELLKVCIHPELRGNKIGQKFLEESFRNYRKLAIESCLLEVAISNSTAIKCYLKLGARELCVNKKFYSDGEDAVTMLIPL